MPHQISAAPPSEVAKLEWPPYVDAEERKCLREGTRIEAAPKLTGTSGRPRPRWATTAGVLLAPESELTEGDRGIRKRWRALITEASETTDVAARAPSASARD